ncbi:MAG: DUF4340 domain-containing protein [Gemmataceae bacterium]
MNLKSTILIVALAAGAGLWLWKGDDWTAKSAAPAESKSLAALDADFQPGKLTRIEITGENGLVLEKADGEVGWKLPGNWPLRKQEVAELADLFTGLKSRFLPLPVAENEDLSRYGLGAADKPLTVKVAAGANSYTLAFGEPKPADGDSPFTRPAYLRINDFPELIRLGPDVMPVLRRPADSYRRRQLFPDSERIKIAAAGGSPFGPSGGSSVVPLITDRAKEIEVRTTSKDRTLFGVAIPRTETFKLVRVAPFPKPVATEKGGEATIAPQRIADAWELAVPQRDRVDADKLQSLLASIPDLWVEEFATDATKAGLDKPERTLTVTQTDGSKLVLLVGAVAKTVERDVPAPSPPPMPGLPPLPPMTRKVKEEYLFAKLADNPQVFMLRAEKLNDLFPKADGLRDPQLAAFSTDEVQEVSIARPGQPPVKLVKKDAKWMVDRQPAAVAADSAAVNDLLNQLSGLRRGSAEVVGSPDAVSVSLVVKEKRAEGEPPATPRTIQIHLGKPKLGPWPAIASATSALVAVGVGANAEGEQIAARVEGWPRVSMVEAGVLKALGAEFRDRSLSSFFAADKLILEKDGKTFAFTKAGKDWKQTAPKEADVDSQEIDDLVTALGRLRAEKFLADRPTPDDLKRHGLDSPRAKWTVLNEGKESLVLLVGKDNAAKLGTGDSIVQLAPDVITKLVADYRPKKVWTLDEARVDSIEVDWAGKKFKLQRQGTGWEDPAAPKDQVIDKSVSELLTALGALKAERWTSLDAKAAGLEKPAGTITLSLRDKTTRVVAIGSETDGKKRHAKTGDAGSEVFVLSEADAAKLTRDRSAYVEKAEPKKDEKAEPKKGEKK